MTIQSLGVGSGLDLESLVQQLVAVERQPRIERFARQEQTFEAELSAVGQVKSVLSEFEDAVEALRQTDVLQARTPTIVDPSEDFSPFTADPNTEAVPGTYQIAIASLATSSRIVTADALNGGFTSSDDVVLSSGSSDLTFRNGLDGEEFTITIEAGTTLSQLQDQINNDENNFGVNVNVINTNTEEGGTRLVFTSDKTGEGNDLSIINANNNAELNAISTTNSAGTATYLSPVETAQNAVAFIDGIQVESATNSFSNALENISFEAQGVSETDALGDPIASTLTVGFDQEGLKENIQSFVDKYNELFDELTQLSSYGLTEEDPDGPLAGDSTVRGLLSNLANIVSRSVEESEIGSLFALGIELSSDGRLEIGSTSIGVGTGAQRLDDALANNFDDISNLFSSENGIANLMLTYTEEFTRSTGILSSREDSIETQIQDLQDSRDAFERRMEDYEETLRARYLALDSTVANLQSTGNALFAALGGATNGQ
ncbi:MAG: flagellar filament capping protein FliD [Pseudomonadota bacterium]